MTKLAAIVGTNYSESTNRKLLEYIQTQFFYKVDVDIIEIKDVPIIEYSDNKELPQVVKDIAKRIEEADGVIIASPEYDHLPTSALINFFAWMSYKIHPFSNKATLLVGASHGALGTSRAQLALRQILSSHDLDALVFPRGFLLGYSKIAFDDWGDLRGREKIQEIEDIFDDFLNYVKMINDSKANNLISIHEFNNFKWEEINWEEH